MDYVRNNYIITVTLLLVSVSCNSLQKEKKTKQAVILFASVLEQDSCTLSINGVEYLNNRVILTDRSLGIDLKTVVRVDAKNNLMKFKVTLTGNELSAEPTLPVINRTISLDTVLNLRDGKYFLVEAQNSKVKVLQSRKKFQLY